MEFDKTSTNAMRALPDGSRVVTADCYSRLWITCPLRISEFKFVLTKQAASLDTLIRGQIVTPAPRHVSPLKFKLILRIAVMY